MLTAIALTFGAFALVVGWVKGKQLYRLCQDLGFVVNPEADL